MWKVEVEARLFRAWGGEIGLLGIMQRRWEVLHSV